MTPVTVSYTTLRRLRGYGLTNREIAARVGLTPQGVSYRLRGLKRALKRAAAAQPRLPITIKLNSVRPTEWYSRTQIEAPAFCALAHCRRRLGRKQRAKGAASILPEPDCCQFCARPLTDEAIARAPRDGFVAFMSALARREPAIGRGGEDDLS